MITTATAKPEKITYDGVLDNLCRHIIANLNVLSVSVTDDYSDDLTPEGCSHPHGGAIACKEGRRLILANSTIECRAKIPALPRGYRLVQLTPRDFYVPGGSYHLYDDLYLTGPDIDSDDPESLATALEIFSDELAKELFPAIDDEIDAEYHDDFLDIQQNMSAEAFGLSVQFDHDGTWLMFKVWVQE